MRCPEERRRLFFTLFVTQVSCPAQLDRRQDTPSFWSSSHNLYSFAFVCVALLHVRCSVYFSLYTDLCILIVSFYIFVPVCLSIRRLLTLSVFEPYFSWFKMPFVRGICKKKKKKIIALTCRSGIENCWFQGA